ncbi:MAG: AAA family ATPase, partial [Gordonia sp. (in: high G+C Gram-positive bacteria)]|uniref:AAA family ATPase n=1 Tax=Gordonia sp. (in: high G+C Gram-positive bacteria) TaxID=84139 RepID=UPI003C790C79
MTEIRTRKPSGTIPWPLVLIEGPEKSGKSYIAALFTASDRIGATYWLDLGEGAADEYAAIDGAKYDVVVHNGTWPDIYGQVAAIHAEAARAAAAGEKPVVLVIDSMTAEWELLKDWVSTRARNSPAAQKKLAADPEAEIKAPMNLWNAAGERHSSLMHLLMTFPGIAIITARGKEVSSLDDNGRPIPNSKEHKVEGHKSLAFDATAWVRLSRDMAPLVVGVRSVHSGLRPGVDKPQTEPNFSIEWLIFDLMKCDPTTSRIRDHVQTQPVDFPPLSDSEVDAVLAEIAAAEYVDEVKAIGIRVGHQLKVTPRAREVIEAAESRKTAISEGRHSSPVEGAGDE